MIGGLQLHLNKRELNALTVVLFFAVAPLFFKLNAWISLYFVLMVALRLVLNGQKNPFPKRWMVFLLMLIGLVNFFIQYPIPIVRSAAVALLVSMLGVKLMEVKQRRDLYVVVFLGYFTLVTQFLYRQDMLLAGYVFLVVVALTAILVESSRHAPSSTLWSPARISLTLLAQSIPVMIVLFLFFPRLSGPLWNLGFGENSGVTGLSDKIRPGSISELSQSTEVAFRAHFNRPPPLPWQRYWRGPIFWDTNGIEWDLGPRMQQRTLQLHFVDEPINYSVILEPTNQKWLFALDLPDTIPPQTSITPDFQLMRENPIERRINYEMSSRLIYNTGEIADDEWIRGLALPDNITPRMQQLVSEWQRKSQSNTEVVDQALNYFRQQPFYYTLFPPLLEDNPADQFLFDSRRGFCEHYATSFTLLMRVAGIPARVVTGYQGGEVNPVGNYLIIRQSDAHAWSEVWLEGRGWVRIDPTAAVAPERIEQTVNFNLADNTIGVPVNFNMQDADWLKSVANQLRWGLDAINTGWHRWVLGYSHSRQSSFMQMLGLEFLKGRYLAIGMVIFTTIVMTVIALYLWRTGREKIDAVKAAYLRFCDKLARKGITRNPSEGPKDFAARVKQLRPDLSDKVEQITRLYIALRYGRVNAKAQQQELQRQIREFKP